MISSKNFKAMVFATNMAFFCGCVPYRFKKQRSGKQVITPFVGPARRVLVWFNFSVNFFYVLFISYRILEKGSEASIPFLVQMGYLFWSYAMPVVLQINTLWKWEEIAQFDIRYLSFFQKIEDSYVFPSKKGPIATKFFNVVLFIGVLINIQNLVIIMKYPDRPHFLTSVLTGRKPNIPLKLVILFFQIWIWLNTWAHVWTFIFHLYGYMSCFLWTVRELDLKNVRGNTDDTLRSTKVFIRTIRSLHVLHRLWHQGHQVWFGPSHQTVTVSVGTLASYGVIKLSGPRSIIMGFMTIFSLLYLWTLLRKFGKLKEFSQVMLFNWTHYPPKGIRRNWMLRFMRCIPIFKVEIGSFFYVERTTVVSVLWTVLNNTITLLML